MSLPVGDGAGSGSRWPARLRRPWPGSARSRAHGAGIGVHVPVRRPKGKSEQALDADTRTTNTLIRDLRALGERTAAELKERWRTLKRVTLSPSRIGHLARAALALNCHWK